jgi:hypothetical protein
MKIVYTQHIISRLKLRKIPKSLAQKTYLERESELYDSIQNHHIALSKQKLFGKIRLLVIVFDKVKDKTELITLYPTTEKEVENRIKVGRWIYEKI